MIPVKLTIRDFLSYGDPEPICFEGLDVACLTGPNGAGKSAILDAITWCVFGKARGCPGGQNQERLIRDGADEAYVELDFELDGSTYRVVRRRNKGGKGDLRFLVEDGEDWRNIAEGTLRETEQRIESTLRMDYQTFTASAFFVQGQAEDFLARMTPDDRKNVFARLLDLGIYERLVEAARTKARDAEVRREGFARRVADLADQAGDVDSVSAELAAAQAAAEKAASAAGLATAGTDARRAAVSELQKTEARVDAERKALGELTATMERVGSAIDDRIKEIAGLDALLEQKEEVEAALAEAELLAGREKEARTAERKGFDLSKELTATRERIEGERKGIESRIQERVKQIAGTKRELAELSKRQKELEVVERALEGSSDPREAIADVRKTAQELKTTEARLDEQMSAVDSALEEIKESIAILGRGKGECPVCGGALDAEHARRVEADLRKRSTEMGRRRERLLADRETAGKEALRCSEELARLERAVKEHDKLVASRDTLRARIERHDFVSEALTELEASNQSDKEMIRQESFAADLRAHAVHLEKEIAEVYDPGSHEALRSRLAELKPFAELGGRITAASARRQVAVRELEELTTRMKESKQSLEGKHAELRDLENELVGLPEARKDLQAAELELNARRAEASSGATEVARLTERLGAVKRAAGERDAAAAAEIQAATEHRRYQRLAQAFGRGGIPDLIIDNARPELQQDANDILDRLTDCEMSVRFEMQRETKAHKVRDTFDVIVSHDGGDRDFAMFSGGEAFRIAFAVRLALSKLLVRRAGARLETLVIDEGFGTQDPEGRERLVEAINLARQEFAKVLVITHLDDLKDFFGAQILVTKDPARGSLVRVVPA